MCLPVIGGKAGLPHETGSAGPGTGRGGAGMGGGKCAGGWARFMSVSGPAMDKALPPT